MKILGWYSLVMVTLSIIGVPLADDKPTNNSTKALCILLNLPIFVYILLTMLGK